jgi:hypothetical protein
MDSPQQEQARRLFGEGIEHMKPWHNGKPLLMP